MKLKVGKYYLDREQMKIVKDNSKHLLVVAGAGSGKTLTILGKIKYLCTVKKVDPQKILCISFTAKASSDLKRKIKEDIGLEIDVYTFHKLGLEILKRNAYEIADVNLLDDIIREYFTTSIFRDKDSLNVVLKYFHLKNKNELEDFYKDHFDEVVSLEHLLSTFIHLFKSNACTLSDFITFLNRAKLTFDIKKYRREKLLLKMALSIYVTYTDYLSKEHEIDFDDMLIKAKNSVENYGFINRLDYIIIDEYQDTSLVRFDLIKSILDKTGASLIAVGDDFQSIYRFTGCDLSLFLNFKKIFRDGKILKIENTYRNSQELINVAGSFVMKNRAQVRKKLKSNKHILKPIVVKKYNYAKKALTNLIYDIHDSNQREIMILGRNNKDIKRYLDETKFKQKDDKIFSLEYPEIELRYMTVHKSKGLESENVILINLTSDTLGFPNKMKDDKLLRFVSPHSQRFPYDEERRLFYVALTRTKNKVYLLIPERSRSTFIDELLEDYKKYIDIKKSD